MISEKEKEDIRKEARGILDKFRKALDKAQVKDIKRKKGINGYRDEKEDDSDETNRDFKEWLLKNAPARNDDFLIAERADWK